MQHSITEKHLLSTRFMASLHSLLNQYHLLHLNVNDVLRVEILGKFFRHLQKYHILRLSIDVEQIKQTVSPKNN